VCRTPPCSRSSSNGPARPARGSGGAAPGGRDRSTRNTGEDHETDDARPSPR
jgi:hypothetical protein